MRKAYLIISIIVFCLAIFIVVHGIRAVYISSSLPVSAGLGAYASFMGGIIEIGFSILVLLIGVLLFRKYIKLRTKRAKDIQ